VDIVKLIESIHTYTKKGIDVDGWKKVNSRNAPNRPSAAAARPSEGKQMTPFMSRSSAPSEGYREFGKNSNSHTSPSHSVFNHRTKSSGFGNRNYHHDSPISIPLTGSTTGSPASMGYSVGSAVAFASASSASASASAASASVGSAASTGSAGSVHTPHHPSEYIRMGSLANKYVSKFKKSADVDDIILNTILLGKLNKFSEQNYNEVKEFITHIIDSGQTDMIKCFMKLVFEKAASEEIFCPLYAKLLGQLSIRYPILLTEMANLYSQYMEVFEEVSEDAITNYDEVCKQNLKKKYRRGYSQFLAELIKHDVIIMDEFMKTVIKILTQVECNRARKESLKLNEEYADCMMKIMKAIRYEPKDIDHPYMDSENEKIPEIRIMLKRDVMERIAPLSVRNVEYEGISNKTRFTFLDIYESIQQF